ncbi:HamA C-terminal domain-containing protein [Paracoccus sp. 22332]|uniref:HamA C-terminal domain-containing protein n=1 Tax=Paracoccus sp. 22332 TaxID=3453913 RepID=UPI003F82C1CC
MSSPYPTHDDLTALLAGDPEELEVHFELIERDMRIDGIEIKVHCHCMRLGGNGAVSPRLLAEFMRNAAADYAIPRSRIREARDRDIKNNSMSASAAIQAEAIATFTDLKTTGEAGELLLFLFAERFLKLPHLLSKMDLKTDERMHYHGADGIYADVREDGVLQLFWGESKIYDDAARAVRDCLKSLAPFLTEEAHEHAERARDLVLLRDKADLSDPKMTEALKRYFDKSKVDSMRVENCGAALVGFDAKFYPGEGEKGVAETVIEAARAGLKTWSSSVENSVKKHSLEKFRIEFMCIPLPSAEGFRSAFLKALGLTND